MPPFRKQNAAQTTPRNAARRSGRADRSPRRLLPKRTALPVFSSDSLSSVAYAPQELFATLSLGGLAALVYAPWVAVAVVAVLLIVIVSYRQNIRAYPTGGDYQLVRRNLGPEAGVAVSAALLVDYMLTVAVSVSAAVATIGSVLPWVQDHPVLFSLGLVAVITGLSLRGSRSNATLLAVPVYAFVSVMAILLSVGFVRAAMGMTQLSPSADFEPVTGGSLGTVALIFVVLRSFSVGSVALTGVETVASEVEAFKKPKARNAGVTLALTGVATGGMLVGLVVLAAITRVHLAGPGIDLDGAPAGYVQDTMLMQVARAVFENFPVGYYLVAAATGLVLIVASTTAFTAFPALGSALAADGYLPRQLHTGGERFLYWRGTVLLGAVALALIAIFQADVARLIQLYLVGVFVSFTLSHAGMLRHWKRVLAQGATGRQRRRLLLSRAVTMVGFGCTVAVLVVVLSTKLLLGAWAAVLAMAIVYVTMRGIHGHYERVTRELAGSQQDLVLPSRVHGIVLVSKLHLPALRALAYARATRPDVLEAVTVNVDASDTSALAREWEDRQIPVPLKIIDSPQRDITKPILDYVQRARSDSPRDVITVFIPEYVVGHWWEQLLHNQSALRLKTRLLFRPGVMVTSVPWRLATSQRRSRAWREGAEHDTSAAQRAQSTDTGGWFGESVERRATRRGIVTEEHDDES